MVEKFNSGQNIDSYCGKCKANSDHTIMMMARETIVKVRCKTCGSMHKFRVQIDAQKVHKARAKKVVDEAATAELVWAASLAEAKGKERDYSRASKYRVGDIVNHETFGKGVVVNLLNNKCNMLFKDRERLMVTANE